jgi:XTP/dITP diphosphohydrolase
MIPLIVATTNPDKIREIRTLLGGVAVEVRTLGDLPAVAPPEETGATFADNARLKALYYARLSPAFTVAEDSGLEIDALGGAPGTQSARFGGAGLAYPDKFALLARALEAAGDVGRAARFVCALALARGDRIVFEARGVVEGEIAREPKGAGGFGYDPIFFYPPFGMTFGEAGERKHAVSHRANAFRQLRTYLERLA